LFVGGYSFWSNIPGKILYSRLSGQGKETLFAFMEEWSNDNVCLQDSLLMIPERLV